ncbi:MAG: peroxidase-related enzyme [Chloroflexi bacterium]|nr:peroxidase-related enzyme [Chloroflexota bacterium]
MYIQTMSEAEAQGKLHEVYEGDLKTYGYVPNTSTVFSPRPEILETWRAFQGSIRKNLRLRRYELVTLAAAQALHCRYCVLAHGNILLKNGFSLDQLRAILTDYHTAGLEPEEVAMMDFARKISLHAYEITSADVDALKAFGLEDVEIFDIALTATMRSFASKTFDALGADPDAAYDELAAQLGALVPA